MQPARHTRSAGGLGQWLQDAEKETRPAFPSEKKQASCKIPVKQAKTNRGSVAKHREWLPEKSNDCVFADSKQTTEYSNTWYKQDLNVSSKDIQETEQRVCIRDMPVLVRPLKWHHF